MLTDIQVRNAKGRDKPYKLFDAQGLHLYISVKGTKSWRLKYRFEFKEDLVTLGRYPAISISDARKLRDEFRHQLQGGRDPKLLKKRQRLLGARPDLSFEAVGRAWHQQESPRWSIIHANQVLASIEQELFPDLGPFDVKDIDKPLLLSVLRKVEKRGARETARRLRQRAEAIFDYAEAMGAVEHNPALRLVRAMQPVPVKLERPALIEVSELRLLLETIETSAIKPITKAASRFLALTAQRPGNVQQARWSQIHGIDWTSAVVTNPRWVIPSSEMKGDLKRRSDKKLYHEVPLAPQAVELLLALHRAGGGPTFIFGGRGVFDVPLSNNSLSLAYRRLGYQGVHVPHGWRSSFSTIMNERASGRLSPSPNIKERDLIDAMLAHLPEGVSAAELDYNRATYAPLRRALAEEWANLIMERAPPASMFVRPRTF